MRTRLRDHGFVILAGAALIVSAASGCSHPAVEPSALRLQADDGRVLLFSALPAVAAPPRALAGADGAIVGATAHSRRAVAR